MSEFLAMGGYAAYVWPSFALTFAAIAINIWLARRSFRDARASALRGSVLDDHESGEPSGAAPAAAVAHRAEEAR